MIHVDDITITTQFIQDWRGAPEHVRNAVDKILDMYHQSSSFSRSFSPHPAHLNNGRRDLWIGHVTKTNAQWRILFTYRTVTLPDGKKIKVADFERLVNKRDEIRELRALSS